MTVAIGIKIGEGLVLAADSASTMMAGTRDGGIAVANVHNHACKLFNVHKDLPIGMMIWGAGSIGYESMTLIAKTLRRRITEGDWAVDRDHYTVQEIADRVLEYINGEKIAALVSGGTKLGSPMGILVAGYSSGSDDLEMLDIQIIGDGMSLGPSPVYQNDPAGIYVQGQQQAILRLITGFDPALPHAVASTNKLTSDELDAIFAPFSQDVLSQMVSPLLPIGDAVELADFLASMTAQFVRFTFGPASVGGMIELATISRFEGFKWVRRKYYYDRAINP